MATHGPAVSPAGLTALTPAPPGPGFFEIGEELTLARSPGGLLAAVVVAGHGRAELETATFSAPPAATVPGEAAGTPASTRPSPGVAGTPGRTAPGTGPARAANAWPGGSAATAAWVAAAALGCAAVAGALLLRRRRGIARRRPPSHRRQ
jgi:hypothetical protein